jgi:vancomycin resistance protein YoaR
MTLPPRQPNTGVFVSSARRSRRRPRRLLATIVIGGAIAVLAAIALGGLWVTERGVIPARTAVAGVPIGGRTLTEARLLVAEEADIRLDDPVAIQENGVAIEVTGAQLGARPRVDAAIADANRIGLFGRLARRLGLGDTRSVELHYAVRPEQIHRLAAELDRTLAVEPSDAALVVRGTTTEVRPSRAGKSVAVGKLAARLRILPSSLEIPLAIVQPQVTTRDATKAKRIVDRLLSEPRRVTVGSASATLPPQLLARAVETTPTDRGLRVTLSPEVLRKRLDGTLGELERSPRDAGFAVDGERVRVTPASAGRKLDVDRIARSLLSNLNAVSHRGRFVAIAPPTLTTQQAEKLHIVEKISEFTTYYSCCAPRVTNIQRAATILDGTVLRPGETFSLNDALGQRTEDKGFVSAPQIRAGRLEDAVGGGISQVATTLYNAAFFAGLRLDAHQPHEFYISRYPMGREATVSWRDPELIFTNDWGAGLLMKVYASDSAITVRFYSAGLGRRVETVTDDPYDYIPPKTITTKNPSLPPGTRDVLQSAGASGFLVHYTRKVYRGDTLKRDESYTVRYKPQNSYVEVGPPKKQPKKPKDATQEPGTNGAAPGADGAAPPADEGAAPPADGEPPADSGAAVPN